MCRCSQGKIDETERKIKKSLKNLPKNLAVSKIMCTFAPEIKNDANPKDTLNRVSMLEDASLAQLARARDL